MAVPLIVFTDHREVLAPAALAEALPEFATEVHKFDNASVESAQARVANLPAAAWAILAVLDGVHLDSGSAVVGVRLLRTEFGRLVDGSIHRVAMEGFLTPFSGVVRELYSDTTTNPPNPWSSFEAFLTGATEPYRGSAITLIARPGSGKSSAVLDHLAALIAGKASNDALNRKIEVLLDPGKAPPDLLTEFYVTLAALYRSMGGSGLRVLSEEVCEAPVEVAQ